MLTRRDLATVRAALRFWQEEICPHGAEAAQHYLRSSGVTPLDVPQSDIPLAPFDPANVGPVQAAF